MPDSERDFLDKIWGWVRTKHAKFWNIVGWVATFMIAALFVCWLAGWQCNFLLTGWILLGLYCIWRIARTKLSLAERLGRNIIFYLGLIITTACFFLVFFPSTLLYMYSNWKNAGEGFFGALLIFGPIIGLAAGATALTVLTDQRKWSIRWIKFSVVMCIIGLLGFRFIRPADKWLNEKVISLVELMDADRLNTRGSHGMYARAKGIINIYHRDPNTADTVFSFIADPNIQAPEILRVMTRDPFTDEEGVDYLQVLVDDADKYVRLKDVDTIAGAAVEEGDGYQILKESGSQWTIYLWTDEPIKLDWQGTTIATYQEQVDYTYPEVNIGKGYTKLDNGIAVSVNTTKKCPILLRWVGAGGGEIRKIDLIFRRT